MSIVDVLKANKKLAIIIILIIVLVLYLKFGKREKATGGKSSKKKKGNGRKEKQKNSRKGHGRSNRRNADEENPRESVTAQFRTDEDSDSEDSSEEDQDLREDADELYNLVHEGMCNGMQQSEFEEIVDDLADSFVFIELKQLYNQCIDKNMDPERSITVNDYMRIIKK